MKSIKKLAFVALFFCFSYQSNAWGLLGHRITGEITESYLTKKAKKNIAEILGNETVAMSSNWGDLIKSDPAYRYLYPWHYLNLKGGLSETDIYNYLATDTATDAYTKVNFMVAQLKNRAGLTPSERLLYLRFLIHVVGDLHQPMHVAHADDLGGNKVKVMWFNTSTNLHEMWDEKLVEFQQLSYTEYTKAINFTTKDQRKVWQAEPISKWVVDSYAITSRLYDDIKQPDQRLDYKYNFTYLPVVNQQLLKGGVHLAGLLNEIFG
ncbi:S1/P1 nuclease [Ferruginibacter sp. HRS2-29]|uniref:S1/P1 nuclease n=1 Tax=Ferruginibacter sp. HRS2-29 TaxID=2487334 RepID=UPI0020CF4129|nr:S1/P1 nuclease [Ferruginibacter sp. HRS2-29]MCP9752886.1 S1/P1 Nuclease [Ferruginibacter sp. HRS2-29]